MPSGCPVDACGYIGPDLYAHLQADHADACVAFLRTTTVRLCKGNPFRVLVEERTVDGATNAVSVFLLLNGGGVLAGRSPKLFLKEKRGTKFGEAWQHPCCTSGVFGLPDSFEAVVLYIILPSWTRLNATSKEAPLPGSRGNTTSRKVTKYIADFILFLFRNV